MEKKKKWNLCYISKHVPQRRIGEWRFADLGTKRKLASRPGRFTPKTISPFGLLRVCCRPWGEENELTLPKIEPGPPNAYPFAVMTTTLALAIMYAQIINILLSSIYVKCYVMFEVIVTTKNCRILRFMINCFIFLGNYHYFRTLEPLQDSSYVGTVLESSLAFPLTSIWALPTPDWHYWRGRSTHTLLGPSERGNLNHRTTYII